MNPTRQKKAVKAAGLYLEMRGYKVLEQNWSLGRNKIDIIASKNSTYCFIKVSLINLKGSSTTAIDDSAVESFHKASQAWLAENKWRGKYTEAGIWLDEAMNILSFSGA